MPRRISILLTLLVSLFCGITASGSEHGRRIVFTERHWFSLHVRVTDGEGHLTGFRYDGLARKTRTLWDEGSPVQRTEQASYDGMVQLTRTDPKNQLTTYQHDALHRLENILYTGAAADNRHYDLDLVGNLLEVSYPNETAARQILRGASQQFDKLNRLVRETSAGVAHIHTYDKAGNRRTTEYGATARTIVSTYDKLNRLLTLTENGIVATSYGYDLGGNITRKNLPNGSATLSTFDALNRKLSETARTSGGGMISAFDYSVTQGGFPSGYDNTGNVIKIVETYGHANINNRTVTNLYDKAYRLSSESIVETGGPTVTTAYLYDKNNNRTQKAVAGGTNPGTWVSLYGTTADGYNSNQLKTVTNGGIVTSFLYDLNGSRTSKFIGAVAVQTYDYDFENRLVTLGDITKGTFNYTYDHRTRRVGRDESSAIGINGLSEEISFAGGLSVQEYTTGNSQPTMEYIRGSDYGGGIGGVLYTIRSGARSYNAYNSRGDVVSKTDNTAAITWQSTYEAFGTRTQEQGATLDRQKANTKDEDLTGLLNEGMRYRDLEFGVFITRDPVGFVDGPNVYTYVQQNPWTAFDPDGLKSYKGSDAKDQDWDKLSDKAKEVLKDYRDSGGTAKMLEAAGFDISKDDIIATAKTVKLESGREIEFMTFQQGDKTLFTHSVWGAAKDGGIVLDAAIQGWDNWNEAKVALNSDIFWRGKGGEAFQRGIEVAAGLSGGIGRPSVSGSPGIQSGAGKANNLYKPQVGHVTPWSEMSKAQQKAFQHSYSKHAAELGLPKWSQNNAEALRGRFNNVVGHIRSVGTKNPSTITKPFNGKSVEVNMWNAEIHGTRYYYYERAIDGRFISAGVAR